MFSSDLDTCQSFADAFPAADVNTITPKKIYQNDTNFTSKGPLNETPAKFGLIMLLGSARARPVRRRVPIQHGI